MERDTVSHAMTVASITDPEAELQLEGLRVSASGDVRAAGRRVDLSPREFEVLWVLAANVDRIVLRRDIYEAVWGGDMPTRDRSVDVHVRKVRTKLAEAAPGWQFIHTHVGWGYRLEPRPEEV